MGSVSVTLSVRSSTASTPSAEGSISPATISPAFSIAASSTNQAYSDAVAGSAARRQA